MLHSVSPISLSTTYLNLDMLMYSICPVPLALIGDRLFVRFWGGYLYHFLIEVGYSRFPPPLTFYYLPTTPKPKTKSVLIGKLKTRALLELESILKTTFVRHPPLYYLQNSSNTEQNLFRWAKIKTQTSKKNVKINSQ